MPRPTKSRRRISLPLINPTAVAEYLQRPRDDHDWLKEVPKKELLARAHELGHRFPTDPWANQLVCFLLGTEYPGFCFFCKQGGGKSAILLNLLRYRKRRGQLLRGLILVPQTLHVESWEEQIKTHAPDLTYRLLLGTKAERQKQLDSKSDLCVMVYKGLEMFMTDLVRPDPGKPRKQTMVREAALAFASRFNFYGFDESHRLGNHQSLIFQLCRYLSVTADYCYPVSGTPFGRDPDKLWPQLLLADHGETLGTTLGLFRAAFYTAREDYWSGVAYEYNERMTPVLNRVIRHRSITYSLAELRKDMPARIPIKRPVSLSAEAAPYYARILKGIAEARGDYASLQNSFLRMRQCASGFLSLKADDESRIEVQFKHNSKLDALMEMIEDKDEKRLVFYEFIFSGRQIVERLTKAKIGYAEIRGGMKDVGGQYRKFLEDKKCKVFLLQNQLGSESINPQYVCRRATFYESPVDPIIRDQAEMRVYRPGQQWTTFIEDVVVKGTVEEKILEYNRQGRNLLKAVLAGEERFA